MTHFTGHNFDIYSGTRGDVVDRLDGIWLELRGTDTVKWDGALEGALKEIGYVRH